MPCGSLEHEAEEIVETRANEQAKRAFLKLKAIQDNVDGVPKMEAEAVVKFWNQAVDFLLGDRGNPTRFEARVVGDENSGYGIQTTPDTQKLIAKKKKKP